MERVTRYGQRTKLPASVGVMYDLLLALFLNRLEAIGGMDLVSWPGSRMESKYLIE